MRVAEARHIATDWIREQGRAFPGYRGAWFAGSICWMDDGDTLSPSSDIDITIVVRANRMPATKPGKFRHRDLLLEITVAPDTLLDDPDIALNSTVAPSISRNRLVDDPEGILHPWFGRVGQAFRRREHVVCRIRAQADTIRRRTGTIDPAAPFHGRILWIFPATLATSLPVLADLGNPTVRKRFLAARTVLDRYGHRDTYEHLLAIYGFDRVVPDQARTWLGWLTDLYDLAQDTPTTSAWRQDVDRDSRAVSIDGTRELIDDGNHREAVWWIVATFARALDVLANARQPVESAPHHRRLHDITVTIGLEDRQALLAASLRLHLFLPELEAVALAVADANPAIVTD